MESLTSGTIAGTGSFGGTTRFHRAVAPVTDAGIADALITAVRGDLDPGRYLVFSDGAETQTIALTREWTRIGRSLAADLRFDDPTVSRRHALIVSEGEGARVLDDRSLNGVFVNDERVEQRALSDGDEILVGRYRLRYVEVVPQTAASAAATLTAE